MSKGLLASSTQHEPVDEYAEGVVDEKSGTADDRADMTRMGKTQDLRACA
jgi:hypothetical protein